MLSECVGVLLSTQVANHPRIDSTLLRRIQLTRPTWMFHQQDGYTVHNGYCRNHAVGGVGHMLIGNCRKSVR
jgi:hypothetical protein